MTLDTLIMFSGAFVALLPFLGFPQDLDAVFFFLAGIFIVGLGVTVRRRRGTLETLMRKYEALFSEKSSMKDPSLHHEQGEMGGE